MTIPNDMHNQTPLPFRGGVGGGDSPPTQRHSDRSHPNPSPEGEGLQVVHQPIGISLEGSVG